MEKTTPTNELNSNDDEVNDKKSSIPKKPLKPLTNEINSNVDEVNDKKSSIPKKPVKPPTNELNSNVDEANDKKSSIPKKPVKPPKIEDKPFNEFINNYFIPELKKSIQDKGSYVIDIKLMNGIRPVVGGNCWMVFCELQDERKFWLCFNKELITSDKTILLAESNSDPSIVESFLIDEKKTTLPLLISRVLQRLNGQKWFGDN